MVTKVIDGKAVAATVRQAFKRRTDSLIKAGLRPGLAVILAVVPTISGPYAVRTY
jgi:5,10-methylene-tetrahydrofolate dehydrogenase/methenyl tetrahydrofolate cyclohydrolase